MSTIAMILVVVRRSEYMLHPYHNADALCMDLNNGG